MSNAYSIQSNGNTYHRSTLLEALAIARHFGYDSYISKQGAIVARWHPQFGLVRYAHGAL